MLIILENVQLFNTNNNIVASQSFYVQECEARTKGPKVAVISWHPPGPGLQTVLQG